MYMYMYYKVDRFHYQVLFIDCRSIVVVVVVVVVVVIVVVVH